MGGMRTSENWKKNGWEQKLYQLWFVDGLSGGQIAKRLGVSRGAVLGKLHRMGWNGTRGNGKTNNQSKAELADHRGKSSYGAKHKKIHNTVWRTARGLPTAQDGGFPTTIEVLPSDPPASERSTFAELKSHQCRWPFEDGTFCGRHRKDAHGSYCTEHETRAHIPPKQHGKYVEDILARIDSKSDRRWPQAKNTNLMKLAGYWR